MVRLIPSHVFVKDAVDVWNKEHTIGNAELAARLGSPMTFDRRGTVFAYDDFEDAPLKWGTTFGTGGGGTGHSITLSNTNAYRGGGCVKIVPPNVTDDYSYAHRYLGGVATHRIGGEVNITTTQTNLSACIVLRAYTGTRLIHAGIQLEHSSTGGISYLNSTGADPALGASFTSFDTSFPITPNTPYPLKFVVDLDNETYVRCMFAGTEIDMSAYTPYATNSSYPQRVDANLYVIRNTLAGTVYFDDYILTIEEPA